MVAASKIAANADERNIDYWDGKKASFSRFKKNVVGMVSQPHDNFSWITDVAKSIITKLLLIQKDCKTAGITFHEDINKHDETTVWKAWMESLDSGHITTAMEVVKIRVYKDTFGAGFITTAKAGFTDAT